MEVLPYDTLKEKVRIFYKRRIAKLDGSDGAEDFSKAFMASEGKHKKKQLDPVTKGGSKAASWKSNKQQGKGARKVRFDYRTAGADDQDTDDEEADERKQIAFYRHLEEPFVEQ